MNKQLYKVQIKQNLCKLVINDIIKSNTTCNYEILYLIGVHDDALGNGEESVLINVCVISLNRNC
jgi:hypothetical protein